jgi:hypothetical protein
MTYRLGQSFFEHGDALEFRRRSKVVKGGVKKVGEDVSQL